MNIFICDDDINVLNSISTILKDNLSNESNVYTYSDYKKLVNDLHNKKIDILIMDIVLDDELGVNIVKDNARYLKDTQVIYITGYDDYIEDCFETNLIYILRKPINSKRLLQAVNKACNNLRDVNKSIIVKIGKDNKKINIKDINYIESEGRLIKFNLDREVIAVYGKISDVEEELGLLFVRVHKSYLVNMDRIVNYTIDKVELNNGKVLPISRTYTKSCKDIIFNYLKDSE